MPEPDATPAVRPIVLVGLMGAGKTTVGKKLASMLGRRFVDADVELEARTGRSVASWFTHEGERGFRAAESKLLAELLAEADDGVVIGAGGGVVVETSNRALLAGPTAVVVYLHAEPEFLASRAKARPHRPLLSGDPFDVLVPMYEVRDPWYRDVADVVVEVRPAHDAGDRPKWRLADTVAQALVDSGAVAEDQVSVPEGQP